MDSLLKGLAFFGQIDQFGCCGFSRQIIVLQLFVDLRLGNLNRQE
jgi:hypothetical protein